MSVINPGEAAAGEIFADSSGRLFLNLLQDDATDVIERLRETHADDMGRAYLLRLDQLIERLGAKWEAKRDLVFAHLKTSFERKFQEPNWCIRINDDSFLAVILTMGEYKGALNAAELWYSVGQFFVGDVSKLTPPLYEALADDVDRLRVIPIDLSKYFDRAEARPFRDDPAPPIATTAEPVRQASVAPGVMTEMRRTAPTAGVMVASGRALRVASSIEPVFEMKKLAMIGHRFEPLVIETATGAQLDSRALSQMSWADREQVDIANIEQGLKLMMMRSPGQRKMLMVVPASFSSFASARTRTRITTAVVAGAREMGLKVLFEIRHLNGVPPGRIVDVVSMLKPFCMTLMGHVGPDQRAINGLKGCGLAGTCVDYDGVRRDDAALEIYLSAYSAAAKAATGACMIQGFDNLHQMAVARLSGVTHATVRSSALLTSRN